MSLFHHCNGNLEFSGLFSNHGPLYFVGTKKFFSKMGLTCHIAKIHSEVIDYPFNGMISDSTRQILSLFGMTFVRCRRVWNIMLGS